MTSIFDKKCDNSIPKGVTDFLPEQSEKIGFIDSAITRTFELWGFRKIIPPMLEFEETLAIGMDDSLREKSFRLEDRQSHRLLAVPPDITPQIARIESMRMVGYPLPHRLYYNGRVLRHVETQSGRNREIYQTGVELIGLDSPEADAETIAMSVEALNRIGFSDFKIDLGQVEFFKGIIEAAGLEQMDASLVQSAVARKDTSAVKELLESLNVCDACKEEISALPRLFGGIDAIERASAIVKNDRSKKALDNLSQVIEILSIHGIRSELTVDLGEIRGLAYHTGITFEGFVPGIGEPVCGGGRYDSLMAKYGRSCPATGFAFNVLNLLQAFERLEVKDDCTNHAILVFNLKHDRSEALALASALRALGYPVARDIIRRDLDQSIEYARRMGLSHIVVVSDTSSEDHELCLITTKDNARKYLTKEELLKNASKLIANMDH